MWKLRILCYLLRQLWRKKDAKDRKYCKVINYYHYIAEYRVTEHSICKLKCSMIKEITIISCNGSNCDYHFIIKEP